MDQDPASASADNSWVTLIRDLLGCKKWTYTLFFGTTAGMAVGVLNLVAVVNHWKLEDYFKIVDLPDTSLMYRINDGYVDRLDLVVPEMCYWTFIGVLVALLCRVVKSTARDKVCKYTLLFGVGGGLLIGGLNFLAVANEWTELERPFNALDRPGVALAQPAWYYEFGDLQYPPLSYNQIAIQRRMVERRRMMISMFVGTIVYWSLIGFFVAALFCFVRVARMRKGAAES